MNIEWVIIGIIVLILGLGLTVWIQFHSLMKQAVLILEKLGKSSQNLINANIIATSEIEEIVDYFIASVLFRYKMSNGDKFAPGNYFSNDDKMLIIEDVIRNTLATISPTLIDQLCMIYKREAIEQLLFEKVTMLVIKELEDISNMNIGDNSNDSVHLDFE